MNKLFTTLFAVAVACATNVALAQQAPTAPATGGAKSTEAKVAMCIGCHGIPGYQSSFPEVHKVPMISGQTGKYIAAALTAYKNGDRKHPTMRGIAASLTEQDINEIAAFYEKQGKQAAPAQPAREPSAQVQALLQKAACASCHGANFSTPIDPSYPKLAGQHGDYLFVALKAYKAQNNPNIGRNNAVMGAIAKQFSNSELKILSNYMASLPGELTTRSEERFR